MTAATVATIPSKATTVWSVRTTKSTSAILDSGSNPSNTENNNSMEYNNLHRNSTDNNINPNTMDSSSNPRNTDKDNSMVDSSLRSNSHNSEEVHLPEVHQQPFLE
ncbi:hypothetical protein P5673_024647 [Acropora cervicornis]|uniref:Uncharacterized protein n=1 Tax=Acropora cervicornis TaxID=6130 RepID=A0AAD9Q3N6_ACRCE|nr:hypothetical protein P5673_024647 [Acropora cervicornis]